MAKLKFILGLGFALVFAGAVLVISLTGTRAAAQWEIAPFTCEHYESACETEEEKERWRKKRAEREAAAAQARAAAERKVAERRAFTDKFGGHRSAEAERLQRMREAAGLPAPKEPSPNVCPAKYRESANSKDAIGKTEDEARSKVAARRGEISCGLGGEAPTIKPTVCRPWTGSCTVDVKTGVKRCPNSGYMCSLPYTCRVKLACPQGATKQ